MTIVANAGADAFIKRLPQAMHFFLVHGNDEGLIHERVRGIVAAALQGDKDPMRLTRWDGDDAARDPGALMDEAHAISMFGGHRVVWVEAQSRDLLAALEPLFERPPAECTIVVEAGSLKKGAALRRAFEALDNGASIECYPDERRSLAPLIEAEARDAGIRIAPEVRDYLASLLGADRMTTRGEIDKLMLYVKGKDAIEIDDVEAIVVDAAPTATDALIDAALGGDMAATEALGGRFFREGGEANFLMIRLLSRVILLHRLATEMELGRSFDSILQGLFIRLSPPAKAALAKQAQAWTGAALSKRMTSLLPAAARVRREPHLAEMHAVRTLWRFASGVRSARR